MGAVQLEVGVGICHSVRIVLVDNLITDIYVLLRNLAYMGGGMNELELQTYRSQFDKHTLQMMVVMYLYELYDMMFVVDRRIARLTPNGRELAEVLLKEPEYRDFAIERVDSVRKNSSKWQDYVN